MKIKYILETYDENNELLTAEKYKTYIDIAKATGEPYSDCRMIHLINNGTFKPKFLHPALKKLQKRIKIIDI